jgi:hypothetical protein
MYRKSVRETDQSKRPNCNTTASYQIRFQNNTTSVHDITGPTWTLATKTHIKQCLLVENEVGWRIKLLTSLQWGDNQ